MKKQILALITLVTLVASTAFAGDRDTGIMMVFGSKTSGFGAGITSPYGGGNIYNNGKGIEFTSPALSLSTFAPALVPAHIDLGLIGETGAYGVSHNKLAGGISLQAKFACGKIGGTEVGALYRLGIHSERGIGFGAGFYF